MASAKAFLVIRRPDGLGDVYALHAGQRYTLGRAKTNEIVLRDDLCSRAHAEVYFGENRWRVHDLGSLNGTRVNDDAIKGDYELEVGDEVSVGRTHLLFVEELSQIPQSAADGQGRPDVGVVIKKKMGQTRYDLHAGAVDSPDQPSGSETPPPIERHRISRDLSILYRLALEMGAATSYSELVDVVRSGLLEATPADVGAVLAVKDAKHLDVTAHRGKSNPLTPPSPPRGRGQGEGGYHKVSEVIAKDVISTREAVLAEDVARHQHLADEPAERKDETSVYSVVCAPVVIGERVKALIHLYCSDPMRALGVEDLEFTVAVAKQLAVATQALQRQVELAEENQRLKAQVVGGVAAEVQLIGASPAIHEIEAQIGRVAGTNATVLIRGESGVGKELVARAIHLASGRRQGPFVCLNCAALAESLLESELFGHEKGAFTGATDKKIGKFEAADKGTIFLDEIGEMNPSAQAKLLRTLEGHPYERVGGTEPIRVNVRVVAATNKPLEEAVKAGQFRRDLYFRLQVVEMRVAPLRERPTDIPLLAEHFLHKFVEETGRKIRGFTDVALNKMIAHSWPGNVRELRNVVERAVALSTGPALDADDIWLSPLETPSRLRLPPELAYKPLTIEQVEKRHIAETLKHTDWNKSRAAEILGIERSTLDRKIKGYELKRE